jgi:3D-(3,5/4)-trihydroxycyclohexane-1,2-dione acylhydrolase (decyclizing)
VRFIGINVGAMDARKQRAVPVIADAREALVALADELGSAGYAGTGTSYRERVTELKAEWGRDRGRGSGRRTASRAISARRR